jgi:phosphatidylserine/phosphatidylglycerophosphate/cardiolipin synthase-like enzyme
MKLIVQPGEGLGPVLQPIRRAERRIDISIFRLDRNEVIRALGAAVARGVRVRALIAHSTGGGEKRLRKTELKLLEAGAIVARTADDLPRYHSKILITDDTLYVLGFNFTKADLKSRSFALEVEDNAWVAEATRLFDADATKQPYTPGLERFVVSPDNARERLAAFISGAKQELLVYDNKVSDRRMIRLLQERAKAGVDIRILGRVTKSGKELQAETLPKLRLHARAIVRDGVQAFTGSQSLRAVELDGRREFGVLIEHRPTVKQLRDAFEADWALTGRAKKKKDDEAEPGKSAAAG